MGRQIRMTSAPNDPTAAIDDQQDAIALCGDCCAALADDETDVCKACRLDHPESDRISAEDAHALAEQIRGLTVPGSAVAAWHEARSAVSSLAMEIARAEARDEASR